MIAFLDPAGLGITKDGNLQQHQIYSESVVSAIAIGGIVFVCVFGGALLGVFCGPRFPSTI